MKVRLAVSAALLGCLAAYAGEIVIIQPAEKDTRSVREPTRSERELARTMGKARQQAGTGGTTVIVGEEASRRSLDNAEQSIHDAQDYLRPGGGTGNHSAPGDAAVILRATPQSDTERLRQKARSYIADNPARSGKTCEVVNTVGTIGEGSGAERSTNVIEKGNSAVIVNCR